MIVQTTLAICEAFSDSLQTILHPEIACTVTRVSEIALQITLERQCLGGVSKQGEGKG